MVQSSSHAPGGQVSINFKALRFPNEDVRWECRAVLTDFNTDPKMKWETSRIINNQMAEVESLFSFVGTSLWREFFPNHKAFNMRPDFFAAQNVDPQKVTEVFCCTTRGLLCWLTAWGLCRHRDHEKDRAKAMLVALLSAHVDSRDFYKGHCFNKFWSEIQLCVEQHTQGKPCPHVLYATRDMSFTAKDFHFEDLVLAMFEMWDPATQCGAMRSLCTRFISNLSAHIDASVLASKGANPLKDMRSLNTETGKRRRLDEDFRDAIGKLTVQSGIKGVQVSMLTEHGTSKTAYDCMIMSVKQQREASRQMMPCNGTVVVADDGSGHGKPSENTLLGILWDADAGFCTALQPQVNHPAKNNAQFP
jgi:hypothetical protein